MRLHASRELIAAMSVREHIQLRQMMKVLFKELQPGWVTPVEDQPNTYEFAAHGLWIRYTIDDESEGETVIKATLVKRPSF